MARTDVKPNRFVDSVHHVITPYTLSLCLAYIHHYTPSFRPGRCLATHHLNALACWLGYPELKLRSLRASPVLAGHIALLHAADLLSITGQSLHLGVEVMEWLHATPAGQIDRLLTALHQADLWPVAVARLGLEETLTVDYTAYLAQTLARQSDCSPAEDCPASAKPATWQMRPDEEGWWLCLPATLPAWLLFDLLQLGEWQPGRPLHLTPLSIASAAGRHYGYDQIRWLVEVATQAPLPPARQTQLRCWLRRANAYQVNGPLLITALPEQMAAVLANRRLRAYVLHQLGPRYALIDPALLPRLRRWLAKQGYPLNLPAPDAAQDPDTANLDPIYHWLGLRLLVGLQKYLRLPFPAPAEQLFRLDQLLDQDTAGRLERLAEKVIHDLDDAVRGRDAFFPAFQSPSPQLVQQIEQAISQEQSLALLYRARGQEEPKRHQVEPLRLEQRQHLIYLHAYSYRAEANLTFRLDRVVEIVSG